MLKLQINPNLYSGSKTSGPFKPKRWILNPRLQHKKQADKSCSGKINLGFNPLFFKKNPELPLFSRNSPPRGLGKVWGPNKQKLDVRSGTYGCTESGNKQTNIVEIMR